MEHMAFAMNLMWSRWALVETRTSETVNKD